MPISPDLARVYVSAPTNEDYVETIELRHPLFSRTFYLVNDPFPFVANLEGGAGPVTFQPFAFAVQLPAKRGEGQQDIALVLDGVDQAVIDELERANGDPTETIGVAYRVYVRSDPSAPGFILPSLTIADITANHVSVNAQASRTDVLNRPFPSVLYAVADFPGLDR